MTILQPQKVAQKMAPSLKFLDLLEIFGAEVIATTFLMFFGCIGVMGELGDNQPMNPLRPAFVWGFTVTSCVVIFGPISGAHMNPCVTLSAIIFKRISILTGFVYFFAEYIGAFIGIWLIKVMTPCKNYPEGFCAVAVNPNLSFFAAFLSEFMGTSFLIFAVCSSWDPRSADHHDSMPLKFGAVIASIVFGIAGYSNASLNPARSFGPAMLYGNWENQWQIYWMAPFSACIFTTLLYKYTFLRKYQKLSKNSPQSTNENLSKGTSA